MACFSRSISIKDACKVIQEQLNKENPFQDVQPSIIKIIYEKLEKQMRKLYPSSQNSKSKMSKISTNINQKSKENNSKKQQLVRPYQSSYHSKKSNKFQRRSSRGSQSQYNSEMTEIESPLDRTYSFTRQVCELKQNELLMIELEEIKQKNQQYLESFMQMKKINQSKIMQQDRTISKLSQNISQLQNQNGKLKQQLQQNKHSTEAILKEIETIRSSLEAQSKKIKELELLNQRLNQPNPELQEIKNNNNTLKQQNEQLLLQNQRLDTQNSLYRQVNKSLQLKQRDLSTILKYFGNSNLLPNYQDHGNAAKLRYQVLKMFSKSVCSTKLLYSYQTISNLHFKEYIQEKQNLFVLIKLETEIYIGGFAGEVDENLDIQNTFLFSLSPNREPIHLIAKQKIKRIDTSENGFLNFGNGQIKIKARSNSLSCNVSGLYIKYFDGERRVSIDKFLGNQERSQKVKGYEIYQVFFQDSR